ncbi:hypothetical protein LTR66_012661 [Elasticomyces elasticus]|nr:hypothetical protein LTR66_012661 [Elasticomyces elasticus]
MFAARREKNPDWDADELPARPVVKQNRAIYSFVVSTRANLPTVARPQSASSTRKRRDEKRFRESYPPLSGKYTFDTVPTLTKTPWELDRSVRPQTSVPSAGSRFKPLPAHVFEQLPQEVHQCILQHLEALHASGSSTCTQCLLEDYRSLSLVSRKCRRLAQEEMYRTIWLPSNQVTSSFKGFRLKRTSRLKLLLRTLRDTPDLAQSVQHLKTSEVLQDELGLIPKSNDGLQETINAILSSCPKLQSFSGTWPVYLHQSTKTIEALACKTTLKEYAWIIGKKPRLEVMERHNDDQQSADLQFLRHHNAWRNLETLVLQAEEPGTLEPGIIYGVLRKLPALKHLMVSGFAAHEFHDGTLQALPALISLRLENLQGVTDRGLQQLAQHRSARSLRRLGLIDMEVLSLPALSALLAALSALKRFTLVQDGSPGLPLGAEPSQSVLVSNSITFLHWDVLVPGQANEILSSSIEAGGFPSLRTVRAPCDHDGLLQNLCRPMGRAIRPGDDALGHYLREVKETHYTRSLTAARRAAQARLQEARKKPAVSIVIEEEGVVQHATATRAFMGSMDSKIEFSLEPDVKGSDWAVARLDDLVRMPKSTEYCDGVVRVGGEMKRSNHSSRRKERSLDLKILF